MSWQRQLAGALRSLSSLVELGFLAPERAAALGEVVGAHRLIVTDYYLSLIDRDDPACPIRRQVVPDLAEADVHPEERADPIGDEAHWACEALIHRYPDRALLLAGGVCPVSCRYCFRKVALGAGGAALRPRAFQAALGYLRAHPEVSEVILSGGDPLALSNRRLSRLLGALKALPSIRRLRLHSRFPATLPDRLDGGLAGALEALRPLTLVAHFNHPRELTARALAALGRLSDVGVELAAQAVLLRGVNDDPEVLAALFSRLLDGRVRPYYLHHLDLAPGTLHLRVSLERGLAIAEALRRRLSGLALPTYVIDIPGGGGKVPVDSGFVQATGERGVWRLRSPLDGRWRRYVEPR